MGKYISRQEAQRRRLDQTVHLNFYDTIYGNARFVAAFRKASGGLLPDRAGYEPLSETKWAIDGVFADLEGLVPIKWAPNEASCLIPFGPVLAGHSQLAVEHGYIRKIRWAVEDGRIVIDLSETHVRRSVPSLQRAAAKARWERMSKEEQEQAIMKAWRRQQGLRPVKRGKKK